MQTNQEPHDPYSFLGVRRSAQKEVIEAAYKALRRKFHPDNPETGDSAKWKQLEEAYQSMGSSEAKDLVVVGGSTSPTTDNVVSIRAVQFRKFEVDESFLRQSINNITTAKQTSWEQSREPLEILSLFVGAISLIFNALQVGSGSTAWFGAALFCAAILSVVAILILVNYMKKRKLKTDYNVDELILDIEKRQSELKTNRQDD